MSDLFHRRKRSRTPAADIDAVETELAAAVTAAMTRVRAGEPATVELEQIDNASRRRKRLYRQHTGVFA